MTKISWTDETWNPLVGCSLASRGCTNCYAQRQAYRLEHGFETPHYAGTTEKVNGNPVWTGKVNLAPDHILTAPLRWRKPRKVFVNSMSDLFHEDVPDEWIDKVFAVMALAPRHTFQVLTKRADRMREYLARHDAHRLDPIRAAMDGLESSGGDYRYTWPLPNVWLGVSVEDQRRADERIPDLLQTPAAVRWLSCEPLLEAVNLISAGALGCNCLPLELEDGSIEDRCSGQCTFYRNAIDKQRRIDWVVTGAESGPGRRPFNDDWARSLRDQCQTAGVPFFFKQTIRDGKKVETPEIDGRRWTEYPEAAA